jgi:hypothetical protein
MKSAVRETRDTAAPPSARPIPLDLTQALKLRRRHERLLITVEGMLQGAALSDGRNNYDGTWSLDAEALDGLTYTPPESAPEPHYIRVRVMGSDGDQASTLALVELEIAHDTTSLALPRQTTAGAAVAEVAEPAAPVKSVAPPEPEPEPQPERADPALDIAEIAALLQRQAEAGILAAKEESKVEAERRAADVARQAGLETDRRLADAKAEWARESERRLAEAEASWRQGAERRAAEARSAAERDAERRIAEARAAWEAEAEQRVGEVKASKQVETRRQLELAKGALETAAAERAALLERVAALGARIESAEGEARTLQSALAEARVRAERAEASSKVAQSQASADADARARALADEAAAAKAALAAARSEHEEKLRRATEEATVAKAQIAQARAESDDRLRRTAEELTAARAALVQARAEYDDRIRNLTVELEGAKASRTQATAGLEAQLRAATEEAAAATAILSRARAEYDDRIRAMSEELAQAKAALAHSKVEYDDRLGNLKEALSGAQNELRATTARAQTVPKAAEDAMRADFTRQLADMKENHARSIARLTADGEERAKREVAKARAEWGAQDQERLDAAVRQANELAAQRLVAARREWEAEMALVLAEAAEAHEANGRRDGMATGTSPRLVAGPGSARRRAVVRWALAALLGAAIIAAIVVAYPRVKPVLADRLGPHLSGIGGLAQELHDLVAAFDPATLAGGDSPTSSAPIPPASPQPEISADPAPAAPEPRPREFVQPETANLRVGPSVGNTIVAVLRRGTEVERLEVDGSWVKVSVSGEPAEGWIHASLISAEEPQ